MTREPLPSYGVWLESLKTRIASARRRAALSANAELIALYWELGNEIIERQTQQGWGSKVIDRLSQDLKDAFPDMKGFSASNLKYMRTFAERRPEGRIGQQAAAQLPWFHLVALLTRLDDPTTREWYAIKTVQQGWSRSTLEAHIKGRLHERQGQALSNFSARLPEAHAALAQQALKDPCLFDFLGLVWATKRTNATSKTP